MLFIEVTTNGAGVFAVISTLAFVVFFAFGPGSIPWLITGELFTQGKLLHYCKILQIIAILLLLIVLFSAPRSAAVAIATFVNWTGNLAVGLIFPQMQAKIQTYSFLPFTIILIILLVILFMYLPETKGIAVHEIEALFQVKMNQVSDSRPYLRPLLSQVPNAWKRSIGRSDKILLEEIRQQQNQGKVNYGATANNFEEM